MNTVSVFRRLSGTSDEKMDPDKSVVFAYDGEPAHLDLSCLKATPKADISSPEI